MNLARSTVVIAFLLNVAGAVAASLHPTDLRCEYLKNPLGIDTPWPRLSWNLQPDKSSTRGLRQTAYQVLVATSLRTLDRNQGDLWDSGRIDSDQSIQLKYHGKPLASEQDCYWKVRVWDESGRGSDWSEPA
ncbi:MAG TPA: alfa-L-rhamnosidase, partial [Verrucomicrobiae bacterium]